MSESCDVVYVLLLVVLIATPTQLVLWWEDDINLLFYSLEGRTSGMLFYHVKYIFILGV